MGRVLRACVFVGVGACWGVLSTSVSTVPVRRCLRVGVGVQVQDLEPVTTLPVAPPGDRGRKPTESLENKAEGGAGSICLSVFQSEE